MDKNNKVKDFFRKEGFYLVLFICLCIVATVAAFTIKNNSTAKEQSQSNNEFTMNTEEATSDESFEFQKRNAERVENNDALVEENNTEENEVAENTNEVEEITDEVAEVNETEENGEIAEVESEDEYVDVSSTTDVMFALPIDVNADAISRKFGTMVRTYEDESRTEDNTRRGIDLNAAVGTVVKAAAEGKVEEVSKNTTDGNYIVISHANGLKTKYANLSDEVYVAVGDTVEEGTEIGTVGNSSGIFTAQICGDVLNLQVQDANGNDVDPEAYFNFQ